MIIKNTTGNIVGRQMQTLADGSEFTGQVTVYITVDGATQALGTTGSGLATHEGHGYHSYVLAQTESNGQQIAVTWVGSGALTRTSEYETVPAATATSLAGSPTGNRTGQNLLDMMELLNQELQLQTGEADVTRGLIALNLAQDYFESLLAVKPKALGSTTGTVTASASTEYTAYPIGLLRIDRLQLLDATTQRPVRDILPIKSAGGHAYTANWPLNLYMTTTPGAPQFYEASGGVLWWDPLPDASYTIRWYGFTSQTDLTASGTFAYPDVVALPLASFAVRLLKTGVDDSSQDMTSLAVDTFKPVMDALNLHNRDGAQGFEYTYLHTT